MCNQQFKFSSTLYNGIPQAPLILRQSLLKRIKIKLKDAAKDVLEKVGVENMNLKIVYTIFINKDCISQYNLGTHHFKVSYLTLSNYCTYSCLWSITVWNLQE